MQSIARSFDRIARGTLRRSRDELPRSQRVVVNRAALLAVILK
jgi:hypothetical protein